MLKVCPKRSCAIALVFALALFGSVGSASAVTIYDNGGPNTGDTAGGNEATQWIQAENFMVALADILTGAGVYVGGLGGIGNWDGTLDYFLFADSGGSPGALLDSGAGQNINVSDTGIPFAASFGNFGNIFLLDFDLANPFALTAATNFWFGIHLSTNFDRDDIYWVTTDPTSGNGNESFGGTMDNWSSNSQEHAFYLEGADATVPEPASLLLLGSGIAGLAARRRFGRGHRG